MRSLTLLLATLLLATGVLSAPIPPTSPRLYQFSEELKLWLSEEQLEEFDETHFKANKLSVGYFDITDFQEPPKQPAWKSPRRFPTVPTHQDVVLPLIKGVSADNIRSYIVGLSSFSTRYYTTQASVQASTYLRDLMQSFITQAGRTDANCSLITHTWAEPSVHCRIEGSGDFEDEIVLTGAHLDSVNSRSTPNGVSPGADDDATGVASFVEGFRILMLSNFRPERSLEFVAYAAEEVGLRGSQDIARRYVNAGKHVYAVYQNEMSGYVAPGSARTIKVLQDYVDPALTDLVEALVTEYCAIPYERAVCGYGCSDHASWDKEGIPAVCTAEAGPFGEVNPNMHTASDTIDKLDMSFTAEFAKLALAFLVELSYL